MYKTRLSFEILENEYKTPHTTNNNIECYDDGKVFYPRLESCFECHSNNIIYDHHRDENYCNNCGLVLKQAFTSYYPEIRIIKKIVTKTEYMLDYIEDLNSIRDHIIKKG